MPRRKKAKSGSFLQVKKNTLYVPLPLKLLIHDSYVSLTPCQRSVYFALVSQMDVFNPESDFEISYAQIEALAGVSRNTIPRSLIHLQVNGFIDITKKGCRYGGCNKYKIITKWLDGSFVADSKSRAK